MYYIIYEHHMHLQKNPLKYICFPLLKCNAEMQ